MRGSFFGIADKMKRKEVMGLLYFCLLLLLLIPYLLVFIANQIAFGKRYDGYKKAYLFEPSEFEDLQVTSKQIVGNKKQKICVHSYRMKNDKDLKGLILWSSGIGGDHSIYIPFIYELAKQGYELVSYDPTGTGKSEGRQVKGLTQNMIDAKTVMDDLIQTNQIKGKKLFFMGHSNGGYAALSLLHFSYPVTAAVTFAAFDDPVTMLMFHVKQAIGGISKICYFYVALFNRIRFGKLYRISAAKGIAQANVPVMIYHSQDDDVVPYLEFEKLKRVLSHPESRHISLNGRYHLALYPVEIASQMQQIWKKISREKNSEKKEKLYQEYYQLARNVDLTIVKEVCCFFESLSAL